MEGTRVVEDEQTVSTKGRRIDFERYEALVAVVGVVAFFANLGPYLSTVLPVVQPKWELLAFGLLATPVVLRRIRGAASLKDRFLWFIGGAATLFVVGAAIHPTSPSLLLLQMTGLLFLVLSYLLFAGERARLGARWAVLVCTLAGVAANLFEVFYPATMSEAIGASAGPWINPNASALALVFGLALSIDLLPPPARVAFVLAVGAGIFATLSKSGALVFAPVVLVLFLQGTVRPVWRARYVASNAAVALTLFLFFSYAFTVTPPGTALGFADVASAKLGSAATLIKAPAITLQRAESAASGSEVGAPAAPSPNSRPPAQSSTAQSPPAAVSAESPATLNVEAERARKRENLAATTRENETGRAGRLGESLALFEESPILGVGMDRAWAIAPHIIYALYGAAYGIVGWLIVPILALVIALKGAVRGVALPVALALLLGGLFSHNVMTDYSILLPLGLAASR